ncbi:PorV/PorQ family protein [Sphingobacterium psychroaquaticum]|uniref:Type IX secretion system membrane protein, PorP/SprF family n=1 Tax=Sphingobacterium psychroaquaticum TaxID=561061 RepID=A0A1X7LDZ5_9SPHI|nr:hypothetical protein [Sphingobacterium psychroaquaticum]SMG51389.1 hypothetical protein SAMN05660862_3859 [Sphingobacterium psychroaquaticum]
MRRWIVMLFVISVELSAQEFSPAPFLGMGNTAIAQEGLFSLAGNPSGLSLLAHPQIASAYQQHFMSSDLATQALLFGMPVMKQTALGFAVTNYGIYGVASFMQSGISVARAFGEQIRTSVTVNYHQYTITRYSAQRSLSADLGFIYKFSEHVSGGLFYKNINDARFNTEIDQRIARTLGIGFTFHFSDELLLGGDIVHMFPKQMQYRGGLSYGFHPHFIVRFGALSNPIQYTAGAGFKHRSWQFDFATLFHSKLGSSPQLSLAYAF